MNEKRKSQYKNKIQNAEEKTHESGEGTPEQ